MRWHDKSPHSRDGGSGSGPASIRVRSDDDFAAKRHRTGIATDRDDVVTISMATEEDRKNDSEVVIVSEKDAVTREEEAVEKKDERKEEAVAGSSERHDREELKDEPRIVEEGVMVAEVGNQTRERVEQQIVDQEALEKEAQWSLQLSTHSEQMKIKGKEISRESLWQIGTSNVEVPSRSEPAATTSSPSASFLSRGDRSKGEDERRSEMKQPHDANLLLSLPDTSLSLSSGLHHSRRERHRQAHSHPSLQGPSQGFIDSPSHSGGSRETQTHSFGTRGKEVAGSEREFTHIGVQDIVSEPILSMARKLQELPDSFLDALKESLREMLNSVEKREQFVQLQQTLAVRSDFNTDNLLRAHRTQLELLVAVKTGIVAFLRSDLPMTHSALVGVFLQQRCRNFACQNVLPADECDCKLCAQKAGFCNACMCVVCYKFDFDANTCRWIGCDFCLHWCHSDCGIRMGYIAPGLSIRGVAGTTEMQYQCIACGHTSELFGFVKDVFCTCAPEWDRDVLARELDCVRRIFHGSTDARGTNLCSQAGMILQQLNSEMNTSVACSSMIKFFDAEGSSVEATAEQPRSTPVPAEIASGSQSAVNERQMGTQLSLEMAREALATYDRELEQKRQEASELQQERGRKKAQIEELGSIVRIKQAEAQMFAWRADEVRREAEGLHRIMVAKVDRLEQEYSEKLLKLGLEEAEERQRRHREMVQVSHQAQMDYQTMSNPLLDELRELLYQFEASGRQ